MARSLKKGYYIAYHLLEKIEKLNKADKKEIIKTYSRRSMVIPSMIGHTFAVHNGRKFIPVYITEDMLEHKLGEFANTRTFKGHKNKQKDKK